VSVYVTVTNRGARAGSEVVQLYVGDESSSVPRPAKELKAFAKVHLAPRETARVKLDLRDRDFAFYSVDAKHWLVEPGAFSLLVGTSAADIALVGLVRRNTRVLIPV
jgi:beta-glucosidase